MTDKFICSGCHDSDKELNRCSDCDVLLCENCAVMDEHQDEYCEQCHNERVM